MRSALKREIDVIVRGQSLRFRIVKYIVLLGIVSMLVAWKGWAIAGYFLLICLAFGLIGHFFFRWKTNGWRTSWGLYKKVKNK